MTDEENSIQEQIENGEDKNTSNEIKSDIDDEIHINYYNLTPLQEIEIIGRSQVKQQIYEYFKLSCTGGFNLSKNEKDKLNDIEFTIYLNSNDYGIRTTLNVFHINGLKIIEGCVQNLKLEKDSIIKIFTYLFITHKIFISSDLSGDGRDVKTANGYTYNEFPDSIPCQKFLCGMDDIFNNIENRMIYLNTYNKASIQKIIANKMSDTSVLINSITEDANNTRDLMNTIKEDANNTRNLIDTATKKSEETVEGLKGQIITIVGLLVSIVPLLTTNLTLLNSSDVNLSKILLSNGILILVIGLIFSMINQFVGNKFKFNHFYILGVVLISLSILLSILLKHIDLITDLFNNIIQLIKIWIDNFMSHH